MKRMLGAVLVMATSAVVANPARSLEVWLTVGEHGEPSFSDAAPDTGDGRVVEVREQSVDDEAALQRSERLTQSLLESAAALEESRLRREAARAERRAAQPPPPAPEERYEEEDERYVVGWPWYGHPLLPHRPFPPHVSHHGPPHPGTGPVAPEPRPMAVRWRSP